MNDKRFRVGFVSTRLNGTDGVSLETVKWVNVLTALGHECFFFAGESEWPPDHSYVVGEAHFLHPEVESLNVDLFNDYLRLPQTTQKIRALTDYLKQQLKKFVDRFQVQILIVENALSLPMNIPLGLALTEYTAETGIPVIAHHHDFWWERNRYTISAAADYLRAAFPPVLPSIHHVVINSYAARQLAMRTGERSTLIPNVMDFDTPPPEPDARTAELRSALGIESGNYVLLQPTRIVPRKRIERSIELARRLDLPCTLLITHAFGDEGDEYADYLREFARLLDVRVVFAANIIDDKRQVNADGKKTFSLSDAYHQANLVTYPSAIEGFGNAFLETLYYRRPILLANYEIFSVDIRPKGFKALVFGEFIPDSLVRETRDLLQTPERFHEWGEENYKIARQFYSYRVLENHLVVLMNESLGT